MKEKVIAIGHDATLAPLYISDLPGHDGLKRVKGSDSDWGWTTNRAKAILLTPYWQRRFTKYSNDGLGFHGHLFVL